MDVLQPRVEDSEGGKCDDRCEVVIALSLPTGKLAYLVLVPATEVVAWKVEYTGSEP